MGWPQYRRNAHNANDETPEGQLAAALVYLDHVMGPGWVPTVTDLADALDRDPTEVEHAIVHCSRGGVDLRWTRQVMA